METKPEDLAARMYPPKEAKQGQQPQQPAKRFREVTGVAELGGAVIQTFDETAASFYGREQASTRKERK